MKVKDEEELYKAKQLPREEVARQITRKKFNRISRFLDNHYSTKLHTKSFWPNGIYSTKKHYQYAESGLCYFYERNNVLEKLDNITKDKLKKTQQIRHFVEYDYMEDNEIAVTIEHCANCTDHQNHVSHTSDFYYNFAKSLRNSIMIRFPFIKTYLKPIETDIIKNDEATFNLLHVNKIIDQKYKEVRIGAFEVQLCVKQKNSNNVVLLHSKLKTKEWPNITAVLDKIVKNLPLINIQINTFDKDKYPSPSIEMDEQESKEDDEFKHSKFDKIKVNIYLLKNKKIDEIKEKAAAELAYLYDPKKRILLLETARAIENQEQGFLTINTDNNNIRSRPTSALRQMTGMSIRVTNNNVIRQTTIHTNPRPTTVNSMRPTSGVSTVSRFSTISAQMKTARPQSSKKPVLKNRTSRLSSGLSRKIMNSSYVEEAMEIDNLKGTFIGSTSVNKKGIIMMSGLPYDSYLVEITESRNFLACASIIKFNSIIENNFLLKYVGLREQNNSTPEVFLYINRGTNQDKNDFSNMEMVSGAEIYLKRCLENTGDSQSINETKNMIKLKEIDANQGCYEETVVPGKYLIVVKKNGFDSYKNEIELSAGENKINIEMFVEKPSKLKVIVYNYEDFSKLETVQLKFCYSTSDDFVEGLTDKNGEFTIDTLKNEDFITILAIKPGFFVGQRTYLKDITHNDRKLNNSHSVDIDSDESGPRKISILLVRESVIQEDKSVVLITYSNLLGDNFSTIILNTENVNSMLEIDSIDLQTEEGILVTHIKINPYSDQDSSYEFSDYDEILRIILKIKNQELTKNYEINHNSSLKGLQKFSCESILYTCNNVFFLQPPQFSRTSSFEYIDIGFLDINNHIFYELGLLLKDHLEKNLFFEEWIAFLQIIIDKKIHSKLFESFGFNKGSYTQTDRLIPDEGSNSNLFLKNLRNIVGDELSIDFSLYLCDLMKTNSNMVSYSIFKKKIASNLKNFKDIKYFSATEKFGVSLSKFK